MEDNLGKKENKNEKRNNNDKLFANYKTFSLRSPSTPLRLSSLFSTTDNHVKLAQDLSPCSSQKKF